MGKKNTIKDPDIGVKVRLIQSYALTPGGRVRPRGMVLDLSREKAMELINNNIAVQCYNHIIQQYNGNNINS